MSATRDLKKALKQYGFKPSETDGTRSRHLNYTNGERTIRLHLGSKISDTVYRMLLSEIKYGGSSRSKRFA